MSLYIDISNFVYTRAHTGIQRVVREFLFRLSSDSSYRNYKVIFFDIEKQKFKTISDNEFLEFLNDVKDFSFKKPSDLFSVDAINEGDVFFDMDGVWNCGLKRGCLYKELKKNRVKIFNFIYDFVPIVKPQFSHENTTRNFTSFISAVNKYSDLVFFDSRSAEEDFYNIKEHIGNERSIATRVVKLGADIKLKNDVSLEDKYSKILSSRYILFVGTLEPRKNQKLLLDVFDELEKRYKDLQLVFVGKEGWDNSALISRVKKHKLLNKRFYWLSSVSDEELSQLYEQAYICTYLSEYEGFGLPIAESLGYGNITITSNNSSMYEVGKNYADYLSYNSFNELYEIISSYLKDDALYFEKKKFIKNNYKPYTWDLTYSSVMNVMSNYQNFKPVVTPNKLQFVFISIDYDNLKGTIAEIDKYIDFVESYIVITSENLVDEMKTIDSLNSITIINENDILDESIEHFKKRDHQTKNWILRTSILKVEGLKEQFIMLDDDNRPLREIPIEHFIHQGKYNAYFFYDLLNWNSTKTDYDVGQQHMKEVLDKDGLELLSYSSHKPQIIDKNIFKEVVERYYDLGKKIPIDEWSIYFNYAVSQYPYLFNKKKFDTLNWPGHPSDWELSYVPNEYMFENFYRHLYTAGPYKDINNLTNEEKIRLKEQQSQPYIENIALNNAQMENRRLLNMVHGVLKFNAQEKTLYLSGMPYYMEASGGGWLKFPINYKAIQLKGEDVQVMYFLDGRKGHFTTIQIDECYSENVFEFAISCASLKAGMYDLLIDVVFGEKHIYNNQSPYMVKLNIM